MVILAWRGPGGLRRGRPGPPPDPRCAPGPQRPVRPAAPAGQLRGPPSRPLSWRPWAPRGQPGARRPGIAAVRRPPPPVPTRARRLSRPPSTWRRPPARTRPAGGGRSAGSWTRAAASAASAWAATWSAGACSRSGWASRCTRSSPSSCWTGQHPLRARGCAASGPGSQPPRVCQGLCSPPGLSCPPPLSGRYTSAGCVLCAGRGQGHLPGELVRTAKRGHLGVWLCRASGLRGCELQHAQPHSFSHCQVQIPCRPRACSTWCSCLTPTVASAAWCLAFGGPGARTAGLCGSAQQATPSPGDPLWAPPLQRSASRPPSHAPPGAGRSPQVGWGLARWSAGWGRPWQPDVMSVPLAERLWGQQAA